MTCPHIKSSGGTQYCELAEASVKDIDRLKSKIRDLGEELDLSIKLRETVAKECESLDAECKRLKSKIIKLESDKVKLQETMSYQHNELIRLREENYRLNQALKGEG